MIAAQKPRRRNWRWWLAGGAALLVAVAIIVLAARAHNPRPQVAGPTVSPSPSVRPIPTVFGTPGVNDYCPEPGSVDAAKVDEKTTLVDITGPYFKKVWLGTKQAVVVVGPRAHVDFSIVLCGSDSRVLIYPGATFGPNASILTDGPSGLIVLVNSDRVTPPNVRYRTSGIRYCSDPPDDKASPCSRYLPAPTPSPTKS